MNEISSLRVNDLTLILLTWRKWWTPNNASKWQMGFNSAFKGLTLIRQCWEKLHVSCVVCFWSECPQWARASSFTRFPNYTQRQITVCRTPVDEWTARRRDLYLATHNTHNRYPSIPTLGFEPTISAGEQPQTNALNREATGTGICILYHGKITNKSGSVCYRTSQLLDYTQAYSNIHRSM